MSTAVTYNSLVSDIQAYLERGFSQATDPYVFTQIPRLITLAERRLARDMKLQGFQAQVATILQPGVAVYPKPDRWRDTVSMNIGIGTGFNTRKQIYLRSYEACRQFFPNETIQGEPEYFADYDYSYWFIVPTPVLHYPMEVLYYELPPLLNQDRQTNWLTKYAPNALLYASLLEAAPFLKNDERIQVWQGFYDHAVQSLNQEDVGKILNRGAVRTEV
jgi:hypothetical protein